MATSRFELATSRDMSETGNLTAEPFQYIKRAAQSKYIVGKYHVIVVLGESVGQLAYIYDRYIVISLLSFQVLFDFLPFL